VTPKGHVQPGLLPEAELDALAQQTQASVNADAYGSRATGPASQDFAVAWRRYVGIYFDVLARDRLPTEDELAEFRDVARRRLHQSIELVEIQRAFRTGARVLLDITLERLPDIDPGRVATVTLQFADMMSTAAEQAYLEEQRAVATANQNATVELLLRLLAGEIQVDDTEFAQTQGYDLRQSFVVVSFAGGRTAGSTDVHNAQCLRDTLQGLLPYALQLAPSADELIALVPGDSISNLRSLLRDVLGNDERLQAFRAGIALPSTGAKGLLRGSDESRRARLVGEILDPTQRIHLWDEIRDIDVFSEAGRINAFVNRTLGPIILHDKRRGTQLLQTLAAFLDANGNRKTAARAMTIHINTLDYRLRQIQTILGHRSLAQNPFELHLAVRLFPLYDKQSIETLDREEARPSSA